MNVPSDRPDIVVIMTDQERAAPPYESDDLAAWRDRTLAGRVWFDDHAVNFARHYTGSLACVPSRPTIFTGHYPDVHGVTQTDGLGKMADDSRLRWLPTGEVPTLGNWFRSAGYDTHYDGKWHISHADLHDDDGKRLDTNDDEGNVDDAAVETYRTADPLAPYGFSGWVGPEPHGGKLADAGVRRDPLIAARVVAWLDDRYARRRAGDPGARRPFLLVASFVNPHDIVLFPLWARRGTPLVPATARSTSDRGGADRRRGPGEQAGRPDRLPRRIPVGVRAGRRSCPDLREAGPAVSRPLLPAARRGRRSGSTRSGGRSPRAARSTPSSCAPPITVSCSALTAGCTRSGSSCTTRQPGCRSRSHGSVTARRPARSSNDAPTSHVDLVPTLLAAAGIDESVAAEVLRQSFSEVHPLPGSNLMPVVDGSGRRRP